jgi:XapX domain-containing protein
MAMSPLLTSLGAGVLVGLFYALLNVRSPAPPAIALVGLLGMILGGELATHFTHKATPATALLAPVSADKVHLADAERG